MHQFHESRLLAQVIKQGLAVKKGNEAGAFLEGAIKPQEHLLLYIKPEVDHREVVGRDVFLARRFLKLVKHLLGVGQFPGHRVGVAEVRFVGRVGARKTHGALQRRARFFNFALLYQGKADVRSEEHTSELQSPYVNLVCRLLLEKKKKK